MSHGKEKARSPVEPPYRKHTEKNGQCTACGRSGEELNVSGCPAYKTAAEYVDWTHRGARKSLPKSKQPPRQTKRRGS